MGDLPDPMALSEDQIRVTNAGAKYLRSYLEEENNQTYDVYYDPDTKVNLRKTFKPKANSDYEQAEHFKDTRFFQVNQSTRGPRPIYAPANWNVDSPTSSLPEPAQPDQGDEKDMEQEHVPEDQTEWFYCTEITVD